MKRKAIITIFAACALLLSGCAQNNGGAAASTTTTAATTTAAAAETTTTTTAAPETAEAPAPDLTGHTRLFRGYIAEDCTDGYLLSAPDDNAAKVIDDLTVCTIVDIYSCDADGWYLAELGGEYVGYIRQKNIKEWPHKLPFGDPLFGGYVAAEGSMKLYSDADENSEVIREIPSGTQIEVYESDFDGWYMTSIAKGDGSSDYDTGYFKAELVAPIPPYDMDQNSGEANEYGFYPLPDPPASSISVKSLAGTWNSSDTTLTITEGSDLYNGSFIASSQTDTVEGTIRLEYALNPDDTRTFWYTFYKNDGTLWNAFGASGEVPLNDISAGQSGEPHFIRSHEPELADIVGVWNETDVLDSRTLTVKTDGTYELEYRGGGVSTGTIKLEYEEYENGQKVAWFNFYEEDGNLWEGFHPSDTYPQSDLYAGQQGVPHFVRSEFETTAKRLMDDLSAIMGAVAGGGGIELDVNDIMSDQPEGRQFVKVIDNRFGEPSEGLDSWIGNVCTGELRDNLIKESKEMFMAKDGSLYVDISKPRGYLIFPTHLGVEISDLTETSFTATTRDFSDMNGYGKAYFVKEGDQWLISGFDFI